MINFEIISVLTFLLVLGILIYRDRKNIEFKSGLIIRRSTKGKKIIYDFAERHEKKLRVVGNIAVVIAIIASLYGMYLLLQSSYGIITRPTEIIRPLRVVLPSVSGVELPGFILGVPFWYWIISVFLVMGIHEPMHALMARIEKIEIKSFGVLLFLILPGAFVDPNERQLKRLSVMKKLRIFAAGSFGNFLLAGIVLLLLLGYNFILDRIMVPIGVAFENTIPDTGAYEAGMKGRIIQINSMEIKDLEDFSQAMSSVKPNDIVNVKTSEGEYTIKTVADPDDVSRPLIGIERPYVVFAYTGFLSKFGEVSNSTMSVIIWLSGLFGWVFLLNLGVGVFNLFPLKPLDGGLMLEEIANHFFKKRNGRIITNVISFFVLILVLFNLFGPNIMKLFSYLTSRS